MNFPNVIILFFLFFNLSFGTAQELTPYIIKKEQKGTDIQETTKVSCYKKVDKKKFEELSRLIGWVYPPNCRVHHTKINTKGYGYDVVYDVNNLGQRILPQIPGVKKNHLIVAGDSNVFGQGISDLETLPYLIGLKHPEYHTYNLGHRGGGPSNTLALLDTDFWADEIKEKEGRMIYVYFPAWMAVRVYGTKDYLSINQGNAPWYEIDNQGQLQRKGNIEDKWISKLLLVINFIDRFHWIGDIPKLNSGHIKLIAKVFIKMKADYEKKFPHGKFTLIVSDYLLNEDKYSAEFLEQVRKGGVETVEIRQNRKRNPSYHIMDEHFNVYGQQMIADLIEENIKKW